MALVYSYSRFSDKKQKKGDSHRRQTEARDRFIREGGHTLADLVLHDEGMSAFKGANASKGKLAQFLGAIREGVVRQGAILCVENLDRMSRQEVTTHLNLFLSILTSGVGIYTTMDQKLYTHESVNKNPTDLLMSILIMTRAHEESATKSRRVTEAWQTKLKQAREAKKPTSAKCPWWLRLDKDAGKYVLRPDAVPVVRRIALMAKQGHGTYAIVATLNREKVSSFSKRSDIWEPSAILALFRTRASLGEFQPRKLGPKGRYVPSGDPITDFYPPVLSESDWYAVRATFQSRSRKIGGATGKMVNLFGRLLHDEAGHKMVVWHRSAKDAENRSGQLFVSYRAKRRAESFVSFPVVPFERAFLQWVEEVNLVKAERPADVGDRLAEARARAAETKDKMLRVQTVLTEVGGGEEFSTILSVLANLEAQYRDQRKAVEEIEQTKHAGTSHLSSRDVREFVARLATADAKERMEIRLRLRQLILGLVKKITMFVRVNGKTRVAVALVELESGMFRLFACRVASYHEPVSFSDVDAYPGHLRDRWERQFLPMLAQRMADAKTPEGMQAVWDRLSEVQGPADQVAPRRTAKAG